MGIINGWPGRIWIDQILDLEMLHNYYVLEFFRLLTHLGAPLTFVVLSLVGITVLWLMRRYIYAIYLLIVVLSSWTINDLLKIYFARPRPPGEALTIATGYSFPSGHAMVSIAFYGFLAYLAFTQGGKRGKLAAGELACLIFLIGLSRVYLNVHYPSDVLGGWLLGLLILLISICSMKRMTRSFY
jgi:undecaprenyl-diphosphatase